ncbi:MAG: DinB family protein [Rhodothermales bacterium]
MSETTTFREQSERLSAVIRQTTPLLRDIDDETAAHRPAPGKWSRLEIMGHLVDSASNNHQRFVRAPFADGPFRFPQYDQNRSVELAAWQDMDWDHLVTLWTLYNQTLARVMAHLPDAAADKECRIGTYPPMTLLALVVDYTDHLEHHLKAVLTAAGD